MQAQRWQWLRSPAGGVGGIGPGTAQVAFRDAGAGLPRHASHFSVLHRACHLWRVPCGSLCGGTCAAAGTAGARLWLSRRVFGAYAMNSLHPEKSFRDNGLEVAPGGGGVRCRVTPAPGEAPEAAVLARCGIDQTRMDHPDTPPHWAAAVACTAGTSPGQRSRAGVVWVGSA